MSDPRQTTEPQDPRVKAAIAEYMERVDRGETVDRQQFLAQHADIAAELDSFITTAEQLGEMAGLNPVQATLPPPPEASTRSIAAQGEETLIPKRVAGDAKATLIQGLPERFGRYRVLKPLGSGAMGTVYLAEDTQLERKVALKTPSFDEDESGELLQRFYREAKAAATLRNPHICPVYDVGEIGGKHYISMAWIQGRPLSAYIQPDKPQPERQILIIIRKLALALDEAHRHGIIHRDLKPGNVMIDEKGEPIVMDFGLARRTQREEASRLTQSGMIVGSPAYMSPEQVEGDSQKISPAADQYSLGVILYELLTGQLPFRGGVTAVIGAILTKDPTPVAELRKGVDPRVAALCARMMAKKAAQRYQSLKAVADEVTALLKDAGAATGKEAARETTRALRANESPAKPQAAQGAKVEKGAEAAAAVSITASNVTSLFEAAQKCLRKHDYEQVVQMLQQIPEQKRTDEVRALLAKARQLADEVAFLLAEIDEAERVNDNAVLTRATDELLKLKPKHHKALQIKEELSRYGKGKLWKPGGYTPDGRRIGEGSWIPWLGIAVGVIAFAATLWAVTIYFRSGSAVVRVQINDPNIRFTLQGQTVTIEDNGKELKISPEDENTLSISYGDATFTSDRFTLNKGDNPAVVVEVLENTLAAKFGEESIGEWPVEAPPVPTPTPGGTTPVADAGDPVYELRTHTCRPGHFDALIARYRDYYEPLFQKLGINSIAYWTPIEEPQASKTLLVLFQHESREAATQSWQAFRNDRQRPAETEPDARIGDQRVKSVFLKLTESSPIPGPVFSGKVYELRGATASAERVPAPNDPSRQEMGARLLARHGIKAYASFAATDETLSDSNRYRILEYQDEGSYKAARQALVDDPEYKAMRAERETAGAVAGSITSMFLRSADNLIRPPATPAGSISSGRYDVLFNKDQGWLYTYRIDADRFTRETVDILGSGKGPQPLTEGRGTIEKLAEGKFRLTFDPSTWNGNPPVEVWTAKGSDGSYTSEYWFPAENYAGQKPPNLTGVVTPRADSGSPEAAWTDLFNGRDLAGWTIKPASTQSLWEVVDGKFGIDAPAAKSCVWTNETYTDFALSLEYRLGADADAGLLVRSPEQYSGEVTVFEIMLGDGKESRTAAGQPANGGLFLLQGGATETVSADRDTYRSGDWNRLDAVLQGTSLEVTLNGQTVLRRELKDLAQGKPALESLMARNGGFLGLQGWRGHTRYRNVRIRDLSAQGAGAGVAPNSAPPQLVPLTELNTANWDAYAWVSPDGLRIYWEAPPPSGGTARYIWSAERPDAVSPFQNKRALFEGRQPTLTPDEKQIVFLETDATKRLYTASRASTTAAFGPPRELTQFAPFGMFNSPSISADGLTLFVNGMPAGQTAASAYVPLVSRRASVDAGWGPASPLQLTWDLGQQGVPPTWFSLASDELSCLATHEGPGRGKVVQFTRGRAREPFAKYEYLSLPGIGQVYGKAPRYVPATRELYLTIEASHVANVPGAQLATGDNGDLYVIRNVDLGPTAPATSTADAGSIDLFNGRDLTGWSIHKSEGPQPAIPWTADSERQVLVANSGGHSWLETDTTYRDFVLTLDWRFPPGKFVGPNGSGIVVRAEGLNSINYDPKGVEIDLRRTTNEQKTVGPACFVTYDTPLQHKSGDAPASGNGHFGTITEPQVSAVTNWNTCEITCQGDRISVTMNGVLVNEATGVPQRAGKICLRSQNADVEFRNIRIRELDGTAAATASRGGAPELVSLSELNTAEYESVPWASTDGLRIYWEGPPPAGQEGQWIWTADRPSGSAGFENKRSLFAGHHPVLTGDELDVVFTRPLGMGRFETFSATRQSAGDSFGPPQPLPHFGPAGALNIPWLSADGLKLYVTSVVPGNWPEYLLARRASRTDNWGAPEPHDIRWDRSQPGPAPQWISVSDDELTLLGTREGDVGQWRVVRSTRKAVNEPFSDWEYVSLPGIGQVHGRTPRYSPATRELFLWATLDYGQASQAAGWKEPSDLWVIRNVDLP